MAEGLGLAVAIVAVDIEVWWFLSHVTEQPSTLSTYIGRYVPKIW